MIIYNNVVLFWYRFLKAKVSILQQDLADYKKQKLLRSEQETIQKEKFQQLSSEHDRLRIQNKTLSDEIERTTKAHSDAVELLKVMRNNKE